jgi:xylulokinase
VTTGADGRVLVAGVDSSTQSCKVVIVDASSGEVVREGRAAHPDGTEVDPTFWWEALGAALRDAGGLDDVAAISVAGQQHGLVALDSDGRVVRPALLWNDTRSAGAAAALVAELGAAAWAERTGLVPVASFTATKLRWMRDHEPALAARVAAVALPHDWLSWRLRGYGPADESPLGPDLEALATDASDASGTAYWSPALRDYDADLFEAVLGRGMRVASSIEAAQSALVVVPRVVGTGEPMGQLKRHVDLPGGGTAPVGLTVAPGLGDNAAAALGLALDLGDVAVSLGTSGTVFASLPTITPDESGTVAGFADASGGRLPIVTTLNAARVLDTFGSLLEAGHTELGRLALEAPAGSGGLVVVPYFVGERTPNLPDATASMSGMTPSTMRRSFFARAAIEGMLGSLAEGVEALQTAGITVSRLLLIGGAAQNSAVQQIAATVFDAPVSVPPPAEYVARGAALQAAWVVAGSRPVWPLAVRTIPGTVLPEVLAAYRRAAAKRSSGSPTHF